MAQQDTAWMKSPDGEVREVAVKDLPPLMAQGWHQTAPPAETKQEEK